MHQQSGRMRDLLSGNDGGHFQNHKVMAPIYLELKHAATVPISKHAHPHVLAFGWAYAVLLIVHKLHEFRSPRHTHQFLKIPVEGSHLSKSNCYLLGENRHLPHYAMYCHCGTFE